MERTRKITKAIFAIFLGLTVVVFASQAFAQGGTWETKARMPTPLAGWGGAINGQLHVIGEIFPGGFETMVHQVYDAATDTWTSKGPPLLHRSSAEAAVINGKLYVVGGCLAFPPTGGDCRIGITNQLEVYDPAVDAWTLKAPMPTPRAFAPAAVIGGKLYVVGGSPTCPPCVPTFATLEVYDPGTDKWTTKMSMPAARENAMAAVIDGKLYVVGGDLITCCPFPDLATALRGTLQVYDPATDTWTTKAPMPTARRLGGTGVINGRLHVVGGQSASGFVGTHEVYDPATDTWATEAPMPTGRSGLVADVINSKLYAAGGFVCTAGGGCFFVDALEAFSSIVPFAAFTAKVDVNVASSSFDVNSTFTLGTGGSIAPLTQDVKFQLGGFSTTIPAGSFRQGPHGKFLFDGVINNVALSVNLTPLGGGSYAFRIEGAGAPNLPTSNLVTLGLTIGNNVGSVQVNTGGAGRPGGTLTGTVSGSFDSNNIFGGSFALSNGVTGTIHGAAPGANGSLTLSNGITAVLTQSVSNGPITWTFSNGVTGVSPSGAGTSFSSSLTLSNGVQANFSISPTGGSVTITSGVGGTFVPFNP